MWPTIYSTEMRSFKSLDDTITKMKDKPHIPWVSAIYGDINILKAACPDAALFPCITPLDGEMDTESVVDMKQAFPPLSASLTDETFAGLLTEDK
ncbi:hypothetical protein ACJMK2_012346 [Sinanodonta woodiana]|uniref:Uncharacterized protein n=1 Tax=Sinanodonta woodiana TaxID=1069815 RepID=A0ABD3V7Z2_SINWO